MCVMSPDPDNWKGIRTYINIRKECFVSDCLVGFHAQGLTVQTFIYNLQLALSIKL